MRTLISEPTYANYRLLMCFFRALGFFPVRVRRKRSKLLLELSPILLICGIGFGAFAIFMAYWGIFLDIGVSKEDSIRITSDADKLMFLNDVTLYSAVVFCGAILTPCKFSCFFSYVRRMKKVDSIIKTAYRQSEKYKLFLGVSVIVILNAVLGWIDLSDCYKILGDKIGLGGVLHRYLGMDLAAFLANTVEYTNQILMNGLEKRIRRLNEMLEGEHVKLKDEERSKIKGFYKRLRCCEIKCNVINNEIAKPKLWNNKAQTMVKLSTAYHTIMDAADALHQLLGVCNVVMVVAVLWGLIESSYFFLLALTEKRGELRDAIEIPGALAVIFFHLFRMLLITEPPYACLVQVEVTKRLVCDLLSYNAGENSKKQVMRLAMVLELRKLKFSACGLFVVNRVLFTSLLDTIATLLVILLQYRDRIKFDL